MKTLQLQITLFTFLLFNILNAQEGKITLDYTVDYLVTNERKNIKDTLTISFNKEGTYYYTNNGKLARSFGLDVFGSNPELVKQSSIHLLLDVNREIAIMSYTAGRNKFLMSLDVNNFAPPVPPEEAFNITVKKVRAKRKQVTFELWESGSDEDPMKIELDPRRPFSLEPALVFIIDKIGGQEINAFEIPSGILVKVQSKEGDFLLEAYKIDDQPKHITIQQNFIVED